MRTVLIISHNFNTPENIGSIRIRGLARYLPQFGWNPIILSQGVNSDSRYQVITIPPSPGHKANLEAGLTGAVGHRPGGVAQFASKVYKNIFWYPDTYHHWRHEGVKTGSRILSENRIDAIISSAFAVSSHIIANRLVSRSGIPWIADFRDLWTQNHYNSHFRVRTLFERRLEVDTLKNADALVTVSEPLSEKIAQLHHGRPVFTILNGFDPNQVNYDNPQSKELTITYTGNLYKGRRDPTILLKVLREMIDQRQVSSDRVSLHFYGKKEPWLFDSVKQFDLLDSVSIHGPVSREESIEKQRAAQVLLLLTWNNPGEDGVYTGKLFDYLAARRPILSLGFAEGGVVKELLDDTGAGIHVADEMILKNVLSGMIDEFDKYSAVRYRGIDSRVMTYSQIEMARRFAHVLDLVSPV